MICKPIKYRTRLILGFISVSLILTGYGVMSVIQHSNNSTDTTIPNLVQFAKACHKIITPDSSGHRWLLDDLWATGERFTIGMASGVFLSVITGILIGCYEPASAMLRPPLIFFSKVPQTAMLALYFFLFGTGEVLYLALIGLGIFSPIALSIYDSIKNDVKEDLIFKTFTLGASNMETVCEVVCKQILPRIIIFIQGQIGPALVYLVAAEWVMADVGFGYRLRIQLRLLNMSIVYLYLVILGGAGFFMEWTMTLTRRKLCRRWFGE